MLSKSANLFRTYANNRRMIVNAMRSFATDTQGLDTILYPSGQVPKPETNKKYVRLYGHNCCAYSERARIAFRAKEVDFQGVEMDMREKAAWHVAANGGFVPIVEIQDGTLIFESRVLMELANDLGGTKGFELYSKNSVTAAK
jgi:hypothetical protein